MVDIRIDDLVIKSDITCWSIYSIKTRSEDSIKAGEEYEIPLGYYPSLSVCLDAILERDLRDYNAKSISELLDEIKKLKEIIRGIKDEVR